MQKSPPITFLAISDEYTIVFFILHKMAACSHFLMAENKLVIAFLVISHNILLFIIVFKLNGGGHFGRLPPDRDLLRR